MLYSGYDPEEEKSDMVGTVLIVILAGFAIALLATFLNDPQGRMFLETFHW